MNNNQQNLIIIVLIFCLIIGLYLIFQKAEPVYKTYQDIKSKTVEIEEIKRAIADLEAKKSAYEKEEKVSTKPIYKSDLATVDSMSSFGVMFEDVIQSAKYNGLKLRSISYNLSPAEDIIVKNLIYDYNVCAIQMQLIGNYMQFRSYFQDIYNYPYLINLDKISIKPYENDKRILIADVTVTLYSARNEMQKAALKAAAEDSAPAAGDEKVDTTAAGQAAGQ